jgi:hypothetical protein
VSSGRLKIKGVKKIDFAHLSTALGSSFQYLCNKKKNTKKFVLGEKLSTKNHTPCFKAISGWSAILQLKCWPFLGLASPLNPRNICVGDLEALLGCITSQHERWSKGWYPHNTWYS